MIPTRQQLEDGRHYGYRTYGCFWSFCELNRSCEECDKIIRFGCVVKRKIEKLQTKRILCICKSEPTAEFGGGEKMNCANDPVTVYESDENELLSGAIKCGGAVTCVVSEKREES